MAGYGLTTLCHRVFSSCRILAVDPDMRSAEKNFAAIGKMIFGPQGGHAADVHIRRAGVCLTGRVIRPSAVFNALMRRFRHDHLSLIFTSAPAILIVPDVPPFDGGY